MRSAVFVAAIGYDVSMAVSDAKSCKMLVPDFGTILAPAQFRIGFKHPLARQL
jgi:hypothetical protein